MIPLTVNPKVVILLGEKRNPIKISTNIDPELKVIVCSSDEKYAEESLGVTFKIDYMI